MIKVLWKKLNDKTIIPTKTEENLGYDVYHTYEELFTLEPHTTTLLPTGLAAAIVEDTTIVNADTGEEETAIVICNDYGLIAKDRGSTGSKGLHTYCGVIDAGYRGEIFIAVHNGNDVPVIFAPASKARDEYDADGKLLSIIYPLNKAIAQLIPVENFHFQSEEVTDDELWNSLCNTERGSGKLGSSGK